MSKNAGQDEKKDPFDGEYIGNIWGWRVSFIGLAVILFFLGLIIYRFQTLDLPPEGSSDPAESVVADSIPQPQPSQY